MTDEAAQQRFNRLEELKAEIAAAAGLTPADQRVIMLAGLRFQHEEVLAEIVAGQRPDPSVLTSLTKVIAELTPPPKEEDIKIVVEFINPLQSNAAGAGADHPLAAKRTLTLDELREVGRIEAAAEAEAKRLSPPIIDAKAVEVDHAQTALPSPSAAQQTQRAPAAQPTPPQPVLTPADRSRSFHDGGLLRGDQHPSGGGQPSGTISDWVCLVRIPAKYPNGVDRWPNPTRGTP